MEPIPLCRSCTAMNTAQTGRTREHWYGTYSVYRRQDVRGGLASTEVPEERLFHSEVRKRFPERSLHDIVHCSRMLREEGDRAGREHQVCSHQLQSIRRLQFARGKPRHLPHNNSTTD